MQKAKHGVHKRQALLVIGMHRSGSSAVSGMLAKLGAQSPRSLMPPTKSNPKGYWESVALMGFHDEILVSAGSQWSDWDSFNPDWMASPASREFFDRIPSILDQEFGKAPLMLIKDPRVSRLLPFWLRALADLDITPKFVLPLRHPMEVTRSIATRDEFGRHQSQLMWLRHMLDAEFGSRNYDRIFVRYDDLLADWRGEATKIGKALHVKWPRWSGASQADIDEFLTTELRHHATDDAASAGGTQFATWVAEAYQALLHLASAPADAKTAMSTLDDIREEFNRSGAIYAPLVHEVGGRLQAALSSRDAELENLNAEKAGTERFAQERVDEIARLSMTVSELEESIEKGHQERARVESRERELEDRIKALEHERQVSDVALREAGVTHATELQERVHEIAGLSAMVIELEESIAKERQERDRMDSRGCELEGRIKALEHEKQMGDAALREAEAIHATELQDANDEKVKIEQSLQERFREIAGLSVMVFELEESVAKGRQERERMESRERELEGAVKVLEHGKLESDAAHRALARELELYRKAASDQRAEIRNIYQSWPWKAATLLRRVSRQPVKPLVADDSAIPVAAVIRDSGLFDGDWYLRRYPDVRKKGADPLKHYLRHGASEGRDPGPIFSTKEYLRRYPDVKESGMNPLLHYIRHGLKEGRTARAGSVGKGG